MSWLFVAFIPGLLMLATFGLDRLEAGLADDSGPEPDVLRAPKRSPAAAAPRSSDGERRNRAAWPVDLDRPYLPTRVYVHHQPKTSFQATRHADRV